jgi:hypothetical protein
MRNRFTDVGDFVSTVRALDAAKRDFIVPQSQMRLADDGETLTFSGGFQQFKLNDIAHAQLASRLDIPKAYYDRLSVVPETRAANVNAWLSRAPTTKRMVRTRGGTARAILSDSYSPLDYMLVLGAALPVLARNPDLVVRSADVTDSRMTLQVSFPKVTGEIRVGDIVEMGFTLTTSEVGQGAVDVLKWIHQLRCANGYIGESIFSKRHTGRRLGGDDEDYREFKADTIEAELNAFQLRLRDMIDNALSPEAFRADLVKFRIAGLDRFAAADTPEVIREVTRHYDLREADAKAILDRIYADNRGFDRLAVADATTFVAGQADSADRAFELERIGGSLVALTKGEWTRVIGEAAA